MNNSSFVCEVKRTKMLSPTVWELAFETGRKLEFQAGQYVNVVVPPRGRVAPKTYNRAYSLVNSPEEEIYRLCFELMGPGSDYLRHLREGEVFEANGPLGDFVYNHKRDRHFCFVATGSGIGPFRSMLLSRDFQIDRPLSTTCVYEAPNETEILYADEMSQFPWVDLVPVITDAKRYWSGANGKIVDCLKGLEAYPWGRTEFYLCGEGGMVREATLFLLGKGVHAKSIHDEIYFFEEKEPRKKVA